MDNMIKKKKATEVFNRWAQNGKDEGMKKTTISRMSTLKILLKKNFMEPQTFRLQTLVAETAGQHQTF